MIFTKKAELFPVINLQILNEGKEENMSLGNIQVNISPAAIDPIVIAGMGPGGLVTAIETARKGFKVIMVDPRKEFVRGSRLHYDKNIRTYLESLREITNNLPEETIEQKNFKKSQLNADKDFFEYKMNAQDQSVQLKDVQKYLLRKLEIIRAANKNIEIYQGPQNLIEKIDPHHCIATLAKPDGSKTDIKFKYFVAADGARRSMASKLDHSPAHKITYGPTFFQPRQPEAGTISLQALPRADFDPPDPRREQKFRLADLPQLNELGWDKPYFPNAYVFSNKEATKFFVSGEIPPIILKLVNNKNTPSGKPNPNEVVIREMLAKWGKFILKTKYGYDPDKIVLAIKSQTPKNEKERQKSKLVTTAFPLKISIADKPSVKLGTEENPGAFLLIGDAYKNANFFFAHGMNDAILDGKKAASLIDESLKGEFDFAAFNAYQGKKKDWLERLMKTQHQPGDMPNIWTNIEHYGEKLLKTAKEYETAEIKEDIKALEQLLKEIKTTQFDPHLFYLKANKIHSEIEKKIKKKGSKAILHSFDDKLQKLAKLKNNLDKSLQLYFYYNQEQRKRKEEKLPNRAVEDPAKVSVQTTKKVKK